MPWRVTIGIVSNVQTNSIILVFSFRVLYETCGSWLSSKPVVLPQGDVNQKHVRFLGTLDSLGMERGLWAAFWFLQSTLKRFRAHVHLVKNYYLGQDAIFIYFFYLSEPYMCYLLSHFFITPLIAAAV